MATTLDGPVGIVKPGSWWRKQRVTNWARDQVKIIQLLASVPAAQGGQKESWTVPPLAGADGACPSHLADAIWSFQQYWKSRGEFHNIDGVVDPGGHTVRKLDQLGSGPKPPPLPVVDFVCGPDVTAEVQGIWSRIQTEFRVRPRRDKIKLCNKILLPINNPAGLVREVLDTLKSGQVPNLQQLMAKVRAHADITGWDVLPLYQGASEWLRTPPVFDPAKNGPFATPSSSDYSNPDPFASGHEDEATCSNTVQVAGKCWLNGSVNYGTYGIMVKECSDFAASDIFLPNFRSKDPFDQPLKLNPVVRAIYSLTWATMLIKAYKKFGDNPEGAVVPVAWTEATFRGGPSATPGIPGNRPKCQCKPGLTGSIVSWDYVWEPLKPRIP